MATELYMPKNGMDMTEGTIVRWLKNVGDAVDKDEAVMEIETDKITMESESPVSGVLLAKLYEDGAVVPVLTTVGYIGEAGEKIPEKESVAEPSAVSRSATEAKEAAKPAAGTKAPETGTPLRPGEYHVAVIGGGPAGYVAAIRAAQLGGRVILFEKDTVGGTCLNRGCIPTKTYLKTAEYIHHIKGAADRGIIVNAETRVDMPKVVAYKDRVVRTLTGGVAGLLKSNGVEVIKGTARLKTATCVECEGKTYDAQKIILCGGSRAIRIPIPGVDHKDVMTSDDILALTELPARLGIIGGGVIGCELASAFSAFGCEVTIVEMMDRVVSMFDKDVSEELDKSLQKNGVKVMCGRKVEEIADEGGHPVIVTDGGRVECDKVLLSIGRASDLECLGALADEIRTERGKVTVDDTMETCVPGIYACGDINGRVMLAHAAFKMGEVAAENCMTGAGRKCDLRYVPSCLYTSPEAAGVGLTEEKARELHPEGIRIGRFRMVANGRSLASGETEGFIKVIVDDKYGQILGVHMVGGMASEMIAEPVALMAMEITVNEVAGDIIHGHPSYSEAFAEACADALGCCIHLPAKKR
ncbi:MAG: dihydrolipoyl dehydrogenase [Lachnospiraceae bacterium]|nr:dihydrolipoyl dehydrogenase [Lachnospiraceae bacterium]